MRSAFVVVVVLGCSCLLTPSCEAWEPSQRLHSQEAVLEIDHVIHGIDSLYFIECTVYFDGGSLSYKFSQDPDIAPEVFVAIAIPGKGQKRARVLLSK